MTRPPCSTFVAGMGAGGSLAAESVGPHSTLYRCLYCQKTYSKDHKGRLTVEETRPVDSLEWVHWNNKDGYACTAAYTTGHGEPGNETFLMTAIDGFNEVIGGPGSYGYHRPWATFDIGREGLDKLIQESYAEALDRMGQEGPVKLIADVGHPSDV